MAGAFTYNGTDFGDSDHGLTILGNGIHDGADPRIEANPIGGADGGYTDGGQFSFLRFAWNCIVEGSSAQDLAIKMGNVKAGLKVSAPKLLLPYFYQVYDADNNKGYFARSNGPTQPQVIGKKSCRFLINWIVDRPFAVSATASGQSGTAIDASPKTIYEPTAGDEVVRGNSTARPVWILVNTDSVTITTLTLDNVTRGESCTVTVGLAQNDQLKIDSERQHIEKSTDGGTTWTNAMSEFDIENEDFIHLSAAARNELTVTGFVAGTLDVTYRGEFL